jgi:hypothetical protein
MTLNKRRKYSNIKKFNDCCGTALHEATEKYVESLGATIRTGGELDFVVINPQVKIAKKNRNILRKVTRSKKKPSERLTGIKENG